MHNIAKFTFVAVFVVTHAGSARSDMKKFDEILQRNEAERLAAASRERPLLRAKIDRARDCVLGAADDLAINATDAADLVAIAAFERCSELVGAAQQSAATVYSSLPYENIQQLQDEWRADWTREAMVRIIEQRSKQ